MKTFLMAVGAMLLLSVSAEAEEECRSGFLILPERIFIGCQVSENEYKYIDHERRVEITGPLPVIEIVYPGDEQFARLESLMNLGRIEGLLASIPSMHTAAQMGRAVGQREGYAAGRRDSQGAISVPQRCSIEL